MWPVTSRSKPVMLGIRRGLASSRIFPDPEIAQDLRADAVDARVPLGAGRWRAGSPVSPAGPGRFRAVQEDDHARLHARQRCLRLVDARRCADRRPGRGNRAPRAARGRAPASPCPAGSRPWSAPGALRSRLQSIYACSVNSPCADCDRLGQVTRSTSVSCRLR